MGRLHRWSVLFAALIAALAVTGQAEATTYDLGHLDHNVGFGVFGSTSDGTNPGEYDFILDLPATLEGSIETTGRSAIVHLFELHDLTGFHELKFDSVSETSVKTQITKSFSIALGTGSLYALTILSDKGGLSYLGGLNFIFTTTPTPTPTPIPPALLMFGMAIGALGGFGWVGRRRGWPSADRAETGARASLGLVSLSRGFA
jgi:hypothetical protein